VIDQVTGKVFQAAGFPNSNGTYSLLLNIGTPNAVGDLHFLDAPTSAGNGPNYANLVHIADNLPGSPDTLFTVLSFDTVYNFGVCLGGKLVSLSAKGSRSGPSSQIDIKGRIYAIPELAIENTRD
jgi:hypothetical protein